MAVPDIFDEVAEDLRAERNRNLLKRYGGLLVAAAVLVVAGVGGYEGWRQYTAREANKQAASFLEAQRQADGPATGRLAALPAFTQLAQDGAPGYRSLSRLRAAAIKAEASDLPGALMLWDQVAGDSGADPILRDFANLQWALHQIDNGDPGLVSARLLPLTGEGSAWKALAEEGQAMLAMRQGQMDVARETLKRLSADQTAPDGVRGRAGGLLQQMGGGA
jgi:hypothetical protein